MHLHMACPAPTPPAVAFVHTFVCEAPAAAHEPALLSQTSAQVGDRWERTTDHTSARALLRAVCILRGHTLNLEGGPKFATDGSPLPETSWEDPAPWAPEESVACAPVGPLITPSWFKDRGLCGINGCPLAVGHSGLCAIETNLETKRRASASEPSAGLPMPSTAPASARASASSALHA